MRILILSVAALLTISTAALANEAEGGGKGKGKHGGRCRQKLAQLDTNKDGKLSADEVAGKPKLAQRFAEIDANGDGFVTKDELRAYVQAHRGERKAK